MFELFRLTVCRPGFFMLFFPHQGCSELVQRKKQNLNTRPVKEGKQVMKEKITQIIRYVGGKENVKNAWHCITRLRFELKDNDKINVEAIKKMNGVLGTAFAKDQFQIVIGVGVDKYYEELISQLGLDANAPVEADGNEKRKDFATWFMDVVSGIFGPLVPAIAGAGMIKGLMGGLVALGVITNTTDTYQVIDMLASGVFTFLPFFIAASAARKFRTSQYLAIAIASIIMYPTMVSAAQAGEISAFMLFGVVPVPVFNYSGSVIPIIFGVWGLSYIHKWVDKVIPTAAKTVVVPTITLFIAGLFTLLIVGPVGIYCGKGLAWVIGSLFSISPTLAGIVMGAIRPVSILVGMHHAMTPIALENFATLGYDQLMPMMFIANLSIVGAAAACYFKAENQQERQIVGSSVISGILGITEPALFGVLTRYKKAFVAATIGSMIGSAFIGTFGVRLFGYITSSVFSIPAYIGPWFGYAAVGWVLALAVSFGLSYVLVVKMDGNKKLPATEEKNENAKKEAAYPEELGSPVKGVVVPMKEIRDDVFSSGSLGFCVGVDPAEGRIVSPADGRIIQVADTLHAIGIQAGALEILIHVGIDTVDMKGDGFQSSVKEGQTVRKGQELLSIDLKKVADAGHPATVITIVTNTDEFAEITQAAAGEVEAGDAILSVHG